MLRINIGCGQTLCGAVLPIYYTIYMSPHAIGYYTKTGWYCVIIHILQPIECAWQTYLLDELNILTAHTHAMHTKMTDENVHGHWVLFTHPIVRLLSNRYDKMWTLDSVHLLAQQSFATTRSLISFDECIFRTHCTANEFMEIEFEHKSLNMKRKSGHDDNFSADTSGTEWVTNTSKTLTHFDTRWLMCACAREIRTK